MPLFVTSISKNLIRAVRPICWRSRSDAKRIGRGYGKRSGNVKNHRARNPRWIAVTEMMRLFMQRGVIIKTVINGMVFDGATKDPVQKAVRDALIAFMAATAQAQAEATKSAQQAGIAAAKASGEYLGRKPSYDRAQFSMVCDLLNRNAPISQIADTTGLSRQTVYRVRDDRASAEATLTAWGL